MRPARQVGPAREPLSFPILALGAALLGLPLAGLIATAF